jgi:outer membrane protein assembly factor BamE (lipoprotein component of BamABCDE complex)
MKKIIFALFIAILTTGCLRKVENSGYSFDNINLKDIKAGITTKENVLKELGSPSIKSNLDKNQPEVWIYYNDKQYGYLFFNPIIANQKILTLTFDEENIVSTINSYNSNDVQNIAISEDFTKDREVEESLIKDIINNIGTIKGM